jgi:hypothetical protein
VLGAASFAATDANPRGTSVALASSNGLPAHKLTVADLAPADEYFGPLKQSVIGMRNTIRDLGLRYDVNHDIGRQTLASAALTEGAIRDWQRRYPYDDQLPKTVYLLQRLYTKVLTSDGRSKAKATAQWLFSKYASSPQAKQLRKVLATEQLAPVPTDTPAALIEPTATPAPAVSFAPGTSATTGAGPGFVTPAPLTSSAGVPAAPSSAAPVSVPTSIPSASAPAASPSASAASPSAAVAVPVASLRPR